MLPVAVVADRAHAVPLANALVAGGLHSIEVTLRTPAAFGVLRELAGHPGLTVGAGTVLTLGQADAAIDAGAQFLVSPGLSVPLVHHARQHRVPLLPGVGTPTEILAALAEGVDTVKFFPAEQFGGAATVRALAGPYPHVRLVPTGGIGPANLPGYLTIPTVLAVGGSWIVAPDLLAAGRFDTICERVTSAATLASETGART